MGAGRRRPDIQRMKISVAVIALLAVSTGCTGILDVDFDPCAGDGSKVGTVTVSPRTWALDVGDSLQVHVDVVNRRGNWTLCLPSPSFTSSDTLVAKAINNGGWLGDGGFLATSGTVVGVSKGRAYIKATSGGVSDSLLVTVVSSP